MDIIVDIDGTLADCTHRLHFITPPQTGSDRDEDREVARTFKKDWDSFFAACGGDAPILPVVNLIEALALADHQLIFCTGRPERTRDATRIWVNVHLPMVSASRLYMRPDDLHADDDTLKRKILEQIRADGFNPVMAIEDRKRVVDMWRSEGLICLQCADGDF